MIHIHTNLEDTHRTFRSISWFGALTSLNEPIVFPNQYNCNYNISTA